MPPFDKRIKNKRERYAAYSRRAQDFVTSWISDNEEELFNYVS
jgi:folate-dependent tRNA-U54 methylase TrmFO/GidA